MTLSRYLLQACNLGHLGLHLARPHSDSGAVDSSEELLPWQMAQESLANPVGGPIELCLTPLKLFSDASQLALSLGCPNLAAQAARDADWSFSELIKPLARQVSVFVISGPNENSSDLAPACVACHTGCFLDHIGRFNNAIKGTCQHPLQRPVIRCPAMLRNWDDPTKAQLSY